MTSATAGPDAARWQDVRVRYPFQQDDAVAGASLAVAPGERLLLLGASGSGKSTLLATLNGLLPQSMPAEVTGEIALVGREAASRTPAQWADSVAFLFQDADRTLCGMSVEDEVAFALENLGLDAATIGERVKAAIARVGLAPDLRTRRTATLSGGEKQLVALAAALAQDTPLFVADEPTAHLSPAAAGRLGALLLDRAVVRSALVVDHRLDGLLERVDRIALCAGGRIVANGAPRGFFRANRDLVAALGVWRPLADELDADLTGAGLTTAEPPLTISDALANLDRNGPAGELVETFVARNSAPRHAIGDIAAELRDASCAPLFGPVVLRGVEVAIRAGEAVAIVGPNGAGKSTLGASLAGLLRLKGGARAGPAGGMAFQNPESQFVAGTVRDEVARATAGTGRSVEDALSVWGLDGLGARHPFELSHGQKRRLALLTLTVAGRWPLIVLDEPTAGLDARAAQRLAVSIDAMRSAGHALAVVTHDMDFAMRTCNRAIVVFDGGIAADLPLADLVEDTALLAHAGLTEPGVVTAMRWLKGDGTC